MKPELAPRKAERDLSKLVNLRTVQKPISDARTATYVILSIASGPGGRRIKSFRPDHFQNPAFHWFTRRSTFRLLVRFVYQRGPIESQAQRARPIPDGTKCRHSVLNRGRRLLQVHAPSKVVRGPVGLQVFSALSSGIAGRHGSPLAWTGGGREERSAAAADRPEQLRTSSR